VACRIERKYWRKAQTQCKSAFPLQISAPFSRYALFARCITANNETNQSSWSRDPACDISHRLLQLRSSLLSSNINAVTSPTGRKLSNMYNNTVPTYLCDSNSFSSTRSMRSTTNGAAAVQRTRTRLDDRAFSIAGPRVWNNLPASLRQTVSAAAFKRQLKTYLYSYYRRRIGNRTQAFEWH